MGASAAEILTGRGPDDLFDPSWWRGLAPGLSVSEVLDLASIAPRVPTPEQSRDLVSAMRKNGFFAVRELLPLARMTAIREGIESIRAQFGHEIFVLLYDEVWRTLAELSRILELVVGSGYRAVPLPYVNYVPPGGAGFDAHRDRHGDALTAEGLPNTVTAWISLTGATPERACLSVLPAWLDPNFPERLERGEVPDLRDIRALSVPAGSLICFNQALLHWGTRNSDVEARVSFAFELEREGLLDAREPSIALADELDFETRCGFVGATIGMLSHRNIRFSAADLDRAQYLCERVHGRKFDRFFEPPG